MSIRITCPDCDTANNVADEMRGKKVRCRECERSLSVPAGERRRDVDADSPRKAKTGRTGLLPVLLVAGGSLAVAGAVSIILIVVLYFALRSPTPEAQQAMAQQQQWPVAMEFVEGGGPGFMPDQIEAFMVQRVKRSTVYLQVTLPGGTKTEGSGFLAVEPGIVITNAHVLGMIQAQSLPPTNVDVVVHSGEPGEKTLRGTVAGVDRDTDLAVVRIPADDLPPPLAITSGQSLKELQKVHYFGFPFGKQLGTNITIGNAAVSSLRRNPHGAIYQIQLDGNMQPGNSGGPVVDNAGRVVGVAVAIIKGTGINFAVPADFVKLALDGRIAETSYGEPFLDDNQAKLPVKYECIDPLGRVQSVRVDIWVGGMGPERPFAFQPPNAEPGDGPKQTISVNYQNGKAIGDVPLPALQPGQVYWVQPVLVNASGTTRWNPASTLTPSTPLQRVASSLLMKVDQPGQRTVHLKDTKRMTIYQGKEKFTDGLEFEADLLEVLTPSPKGTAIRVTIGPGKFADEVDGKLQPLEPIHLTRLRALAPNFLIDATGKFRERGTPEPKDLKPDLSQKDCETLEMMLNRVCNAFEGVALYMPNRRVEPMETWQAKVPTIMGKGPKKKVLDIDLTCTYEGTRIINNRNEAFISLVGKIVGREKDDSGVLGQVVGRAMLDLEAGFLSQVTMKLSSDVEFGIGVQMVLSEDISLTRVPGNTQGIVPFETKQLTPKVDPEPKPKTDLEPKPKTDPEPKPKIDLNPKPKTDPDPKPKTDLTPKPKVEPLGPKLVFEINSQLGKDDLLGGPKGRRSKTHEVKLEAGTTYVIEMKKVGVSKVDPYVQLLDSGGKVVAFDDNSGENMNAKITYTATQAGTYKVVATSVNLGVQIGAYHLTVTAVPPKGKE